MYAPYRCKIVPKYKQSFSVTCIIGENLLYLSMWFLAGGLVWPVRWNGWPIVTIAWAVLVLVVQVLLKKHNCSGCYYYGKTCHLGWGKLSSWMFEQDSGDPKTGMRLSWFYIISPPIFLLAGLLVGILLDVGVWHWIFLGVYVVLNVLSFPIRKKGCGLCAMRAVCPGSAVRLSRD